MSLKRNEIEGLRATCPTVLIILLAVASRRWQEVGQGKRPLTRPAPAGENAWRGPPSPPGEGNCCVGRAMARDDFFPLPGERVAEVRGRVRGYFPTVAVRPL